MERLLTVKDVSARLHCHPHTVRRWIWSGRLRGVKVGDLVRVPEAEVTRFVQPAQDKSHGGKIRGPAALLRVLRRLRGRHSADARLLQKLIDEGAAPTDWRDPLG